MNKTFVAVALAAALGLGASAAQAKDLTGWFVNGGVGTAHYHATYRGYDLGSESDTSAQINFGWRSQFIGVEAGYIDLGSVNGAASATDFASAGYSNLSSGKAELSGDGWTIGLNGHFNPTKMWYISARGGLFLWKLHLKASAIDAAGNHLNGSEGQQSADWYAGVGTGVDFNRHMSLGVNFDYYKIKKDSVDVGNRVFTVNFEYRF